MPDSVMPQDFEGQVQQVRRDYVGMVDRWCPEAFDDEPIQVRAIRAMMNMRACILDQRRVLNGERPIRPLDDYPEEPEPS